MRKRASLPAVLALFALFCVLIGPAAAQEDVPRITVEELKSMIDKGADVLVLDTQPKALYDKGHIKGAISFPWKPKITQQDAARLPRNKLIVTYCDCGPGESDSAGVASQLLALGFTDVRVLKDPSIRGWKKAGYPVE
jgi:rhodanese-related sulfurtransferase